MRARPSAPALGTALITLLGATVVVTAPAAHAAAPAVDTSCTTSWTGGSGYLMDPAHWDNGVPTNHDRACISAAGTYTVELDGSHGFGSLAMTATSGTQTLLVHAGQAPFGQTAATTDATLTLNDTATPSVIGPHAVVELTGTEHPAAPADPHGNAQLVSPSPLDNQGLILGRPAGPADLDDAGLHLTDNDWTNEGTIRFEGPGYEVGNHALINDGGTIATTAGGSLVLVDNHTAITNTSGTISNAGSITVPGACTFTQGGGTATGNPIGVVGTLNFTGTGAGTFELRNTSVNGNTAPGQDVIVDAASPIDNGPQADAIVNWTTPATIGGRVTLTSRAAFAAVLNGNPAANPLTVGPTGTIVADAGAGGQRRLIGTIVDRGTIDVRSNLVHDTSGTFDNAGTISVDAGASAEFDVPFTNDTGGTIADSGSVLMTNTVHQTAGTTSGNPIDLQYGTLSLEGAGASTYRTAGASVTGDVRPLQHLILTSRANDAVVNLAPLTNAGRISVVGDQPGQILLGISGSGVLTNTGTIDVSGSGSAQRAIQTGSLVNAGTLDIAAGSAFGAGQSFTQTAAGTTKVAVSAAGVSHLYADTAALAGGLAVTVPHAPATGSSLVALSAPTVSGRFASVAGSGYQPVYSASAVTLVPLTASSISASATGAVTYPGRAVVAGVVRAGAAPLAGATILLDALPAGTSTWHTVGSAHTDAKGDVVFRFTPAATTSYRLRYAGAGTVSGSMSAVRTVVLRPMVTAVFAHPSVRHGAADAFVIHAAPAAGEKAVVQRWTGKAWVTAAVIVLARTGAGSVTIKPAKGRTSYRVVLPATVHHVAGYSPTRVVTGT